MHACRSTLEDPTWTAAEALLPDDGIERYTQGMMDLGATVCTRTPACLLCPVSADCVARIEGRIAELPAPRPARDLPHRELALLVIEHAGEILFERRPPTGVWGGLWSLPETAVDDDALAVARERFGVVARTSRAVAPITHAFTHFTLTMHPQRIAAAHRSPRGEATGHVWLARADAGSAALPAPIKRLVQSL